VPPAARTAHLPVSGRAKAFHVTHETVTRRFPSAYPGSTSAAGNTTATPAAPRGSEELATAIEEAKAAIKDLPPASAFLLTDVTNTEKSRTTSAMIKDFSSP
jgi:hypothetical protein